MLPWVPSSPKLCACCLHHHIWEKWVKKGDALQASPYPHAAEKPGWAEALLAARSSHPPRSWR